MFYAIFTRNMRLRWLILHQSWVKIGFVDLKNNLDDLHVKKTCLWHQEAAKIRQNARKLSFEGSKSCFMLFLPEIWDLGGPYCTNLEYKLVLLIWKTICMICMSIKLVYDTRKLQKYVKMQGNRALGGSKSCFMLFFPKIWGLEAHTAPILSTNKFCWFRKEFGW